MRIRQKGRQLGPCGGPCSTSVETSIPFKILIAEEKPHKNTEPVCINPMASNDSILAKQDEFKKMEKEQMKSAIDDEETDTLESNEVKKELAQDLVSKVKRRKQHRRTYQEEPKTSLRGVYYKNMKWQAAIKVDKKQIHLGTVKSKKEAAHLYDRAAFMCGRQPNKPLSEEDKQELGKLTWKEFLAMTRNDIAQKRYLRRGGAATEINAATDSPRNWEDQQGAEVSSASDYMYDD